MKCVLLLVVLLVAVASAIPRTSNCETSDDCGAGSCCVPMRRFYILSRRAVVSKEKIKVIDRFSGGRCVNYVKENGSCHMMGFAACGCEPGTKCVYYPEELKKIAIKMPVKNAEKVGKRKMMYKPGKSICEKPTKN